MARKKQPQTLPSTLKLKRRIADELTAKTGILHQVHHKHPRARRRTYKGSINEDRNLAVVPANKHSSWHTLTGGALLPHEWIPWVNDNLMPPDKYLIAVPRKRKQTNKRRTRCMCTDCGAEVLKVLPKTNKDEKSTCNLKGCPNGK